MEGLDAIIQLILIGSACLYPVGLLFPCHGCCEPIQYEVYCGCLEFEFEQKLTPPTLSRRHSCDEGVVEGQHYYYKETIPVHGWSARARTREEAGVRTRCKTYRIKALAEVFNESSRYKKQDGSYVYPRNLSAGESATRTGTIEFRRGGDQCNAGRGSEGDLPTDIATIRTVTTTINGYDSWLDHDPLGGTVSSYSPLERTETVKEMPKDSGGGYSPSAESVSTPVTIELDSAAVFDGDLSLFDGSVLTEQALQAMASVEVEYIDNSNESKYEATYTYEADPEIFQYSGYLQVGYLFTITHGERVEKLRAFVTFSLPGPFDPVPAEGLPAVTLPGPEDETAEPSETTTAVESVDQTSSQIDVTVQAGDIYPPGDYALPEIAYTPTGEDKLGSIVEVGDSDQADGVDLPVVLLETECEGETLIWGAPCVNDLSFDPVDFGFAGNQFGRPAGGKSWANVVLRPEYDTKNYSFSEAAILSFLDNNGSLSFYTKQESPGASIFRGYFDDGSAPVRAGVTLDDIEAPRQTSDMKVNVRLSSDLQHCNESLCGNDFFSTGSGADISPFAGADSSPVVLESIAPSFATFSYTDQRPTIKEEPACGAKAGSLAVKRFGCTIPELELPTGCAAFRGDSGNYWFAVRPRATGDFGNSLAHFACGDLRWVVENGFCRTLIQNRSSHLLAPDIFGDIDQTWECQPPYEMNVSLSSGAEGEVQPEAQRVGCRGGDQIVHIGPGNRCPPASIEMTVESSDSPLAGTYVLERLDDYPSCNPSYGFSDISGVTTQAAYNEYYAYGDESECPVRNYSAYVRRTELLGDGRIKNEYLSDTGLPTEKTLSGANEIYVGQWTQFFEETSGSYSTNIDESERQHLLVLRTGAEWTAGEFGGNEDEWHNLEAGILKAGYRRAPFKWTNPFGLGGTIEQGFFVITNDTATDRSMILFEYNNAYLSGSHRSINRDDIGFTSAEVDDHRYPIFYASDYSMEENAPPDFWLGSPYYEWTRNPKQILLTVSGGSEGFLLSPGSSPPLENPATVYATCISVSPPVSWITQLDEPGIALVYEANTTGSPRSATLVLSVNDFTETWTIRQPAFDYAGAFTEVDGVQITKRVTGIETNKDSIVVKGTAKPDADVAVLTSTFDARVRSNGQGRWSATVDLSNEPEGQVTITVRCFVSGAEDQEHSYLYRTEELSPSVFITIDRTPPEQPVITLPADGASVGSAVSVTVSCEDEAEVRIYVDGELFLTLDRGGTSVTGTVSGLSPGTRTITATATDKAGNTSEQSAPVTVEVS